MSRGKKVSRQTLIGEAGIALIHARVTQMGFLFHPRRVDHGIDGHIDLVDYGTGEVLNLTLLVQSKASTLPFTAETDRSFRYTCDERDLVSWSRGNTPVILVLSHPERDEAWWIDIRTAFADPARRASRTVTVDKHLQVFDETAAAELLRVAGSATVLAAIEADPGQPVSELRDPFAFEVHEAISAPGPLPVPQLPVYVRRQHDGDLEKVVDRALAGESGRAVLLGNSSTGKTRSAWEQVQRLPQPWQLWHPSSADELLERLPCVRPHTVLWLNELHQYLRTEEIPRDEAIAARLLTLLRDSSRAPVLLLGTLWHEYRLMIAPAESFDDARPRVREVVTGHFIPVAEAFTGAEFERLARAAAQDPRLAEAAINAETGHVAQYLAGGPAQIERYRTAEPAAQAVLHAAMDARRFGWGPTLSEGFLTEAALAYLSPLQQDSLPDAWFARVVGELLPLCRGARGPLSRVKVQPADTSQVAYRLTDYVEQYGKQHRAGSCPPDGFWLAALREDVSGRDQAALALGAYEHGRTDIARRLAELSAAGGNAVGVATFADLLDEKENREAALPYYRHAAKNGDARSQVLIGAWHEDRGELAAARRWYVRGVESGTPYALVGLASLDTKQRRHEQAEALYSLALENGGARAVEYQARHLAKLGQHKLALHLAKRSYEHGNGEALTGLAWSYTSTDMRRAFGVMAHARRLGFPDAIAELVILSTMVDKPGMTLRFCNLAEQTGHPNALRVAGTILLSRGDERRGTALLWRAFNYGLHWSLFALGELRKQQRRGRSARKIYRKLVAAGQPHALVMLAELEERAGNSDAAERWAAAYQRTSAPGLDDTAWNAIYKVRSARGDVAGAGAVLLRLMAAGDRSALTELAVRAKAADPAHTEHGR